MKYISLILFIPFSIFATEINVEQLGDVTSEIERALTSPTETCETCAAEVDQETISKSVTLDKKDIEIITNYIGGDDFIIALKRTPNTPKKIKVKIEYGERVCARTVAHQNPLSGQLGFSCLFYQTEKRTKTIPINFEKASVLDAGEYQSLRLVIKKDKDDRKIDYGLSITNGMFDSIKEGHGFLGMGSTSYEIHRRSGSRAPAVIPTED